MNLNGVLTAAHAAEPQDSPVKLTQDPTFDLIVVALALLALGLILFGYTQVSTTKSPESARSTTVSTWIEILVLMVIFLILIVIKNN